MFYILFALNNHYFLHKINRLIFKMDILFLLFEVWNQFYT
jgi:hypothetical protein